MNRLTLSILLAGLTGAMIFGGVAVAETNELPDPGFLPGSPFYFVKKFFEDVGALFTFGDGAKAERHIRLAERRLAEAKALAEREDEEQTKSAIEMYEEQIKSAYERANQAGKVDLEARVADATTRHLTVLDGIAERVPERAREAVKAARERSMRGQVEALRAIAQRSPEAAARVFEKAAEARVNAFIKLGDIKGEVTAGSDDNDLKSPLEEIEAHDNLGREISEIARGLRAGETTVEDLVNKATSHHLEVLERVRQKLQDKDHPRLQRVQEIIQRIRENQPTVSDEDSSDEQSDRVGCCVNNACAVANNVRQCRSDGGTVDNNCDIDNVGVECVTGTNREIEEKESERPSAPTILREKPVESEAIGR